MRINERRIGGKLQKLSFGKSIRFTKGEVLTEHHEHMGDVQSHVHASKILKGHHKMNIMNILNILGVKKKFIKMLYQTFQISFSIPVTYPKQMIL